MNVTDVERLLWVLRDHPWSDGWQMARLACVPERTVYRCLGRMTDEGLIWGQTINLPGVRSRVYAIGSKGLAMLAGGSEIAGAYARAFGLDATGLGRALLGIKALAWGRNLLASLVERGQEIVWAFSPAAVQAGSSRLHLAGLACISPWTGRYILCGLLVDTGGVAVESWRPRLRLARLWAERMEESMGVAPQLVMLTTHGYRAAQLAALWRDVEAHHDGDSLLLYVGAVEVIAGTQGWLSPGVHEKVCLWERGGDSKHPVDRPWPQIKENAPARGGPLGTCMLEKRLGGGAVQAAFLELGWRGWHCLDAIASWPALRVSDLAMLLSWQRGDVSAGVNELRRIGLIEMVELPHDSGKRWIIAPLGTKLLAAMHGMQARPYGKARLWPVGKRGPVAIRLNVYVRSARHTLMVIDFMVGMRRLADWWWEQGYCHRLLIWDSHESVRRYYDEWGRLRYLRPDSGGVYQIGEEVYPFLLEVDLDSGKKRRQDKIMRYYLSRERAWCTELGRMPRLLIICASEGRARLMNETLNETAHRLRVPVLEAYITTIDRIFFSGTMRDDGHVQVDAKRKARMWPGQKVWRRAGPEFDKLTWCFEGLQPARRYAALRLFEVGQGQR